MIDRLKEFIDREQMFSADEGILLAVSGGADSVMLAELFNKAGFNFGIAHCNFQLRGKESNKDEEFVKELASKYEVKFYCKHFDTTEYSKEKGISIEMAARELRYKWFEEVRKTENYDHIATAHHLDDEAETLFINLLRGTGISGLHGILPKKKHIIRPLLFMYKQDILDYCKENNIEYKIDSSNATLQYVRNKIRHKIIPELKEINPSVLNNLKETIEHLKETESIFNYYINKKRQKIVIVKDGSVFISITKLKRLKNLNTYLHEFLSPYNFNNAVVKDIIKALDEQPGKQFFSPTHRLIKDRQQLIVDSKDKEIEDSKIAKLEEFKVDEYCEFVCEPVELKINKSNYKKDEVLDKGKNIASLDIAKVEFPLIIRKWKQGDYFYPFGMTKKKKVSRFLIDEKLSINDKENVYVLTTGDKIIWVIGLRIDNRFRVTEKTKKIITIELKP